MSYKNALIEFLYEAMLSEHGIALETSDRFLLKERLYNIRRSLGDPALKALSFISSPLNPRELWLVKTEWKHDEAEGGVSARESDPLALSG